MKKILAKLLGIKTLESHTKKCVIKPKYVKR